MATADADPEDDPLIFGQESDSWEESHNVNWFRLSNMQIHPFELSQGCPPRRQEVAEPAQNSILAAFPRPDTLHSLPQWHILSPRIGL